MGFLSSFLGILGFGIGIPIGLLIGFYLFVFSDPKDIEDPVVRPLSEMDTADLQDILPELPLWVKNPNYNRVDWLNKFLLDMWPYPDKAICGTIRSTAQPMFAEYIGTFHIESIEFENMSLGNLPPTIHGLKFYKTNEKELVMEPAIKWAGNPNIVLALKLMSLRITVQLVDLQIDFGMKVLGGDIMSIPGLYRFVQETIKKQVASLYLWPQTLDEDITGIVPSFVAKYVV